MPLSSVVGAQSIVKPGVCTSSTRPASPYDGQVIYMTDVDQTAVWDGTQWIVLAPIAGNRNVIINGDFKVWQRATSFTDCAFGLTVDRWEAGRGGFASGLTVSRQTGPTNFQYCARVQRASGNTSTQNIRFATTLETVNSLPLAGKTVTVSFYARAGANFSTSSSQIEVYLRSGTTTDAGRIGAGDTFGTGAATPVSLTQPLTTSWQRFSVSGSVASTATQLALIVYASPTGTAGADDWYEIAGVQVEAGAVATPFEFEDYATTLAKCQRYYILLASGDAKEISICTYYSSNTLTGLINLPVVMRTTPTFSNVTGTNYFIAYTNSASDYINSITIQVSSPSIVAWYNISEASGTGGYAGTLRSNNASAVVAVTAEL